jgi:hypothetical protein
MGGRWPRQEEGMAAVGRSLCGRPRQQEGMVVQLLVHLIHAQQAAVCKLLQRDGHLPVAAWRPPAGSARAPQPLSLQPPRIASLPLTGARKVNVQEVLHCMTANKSNDQALNCRRIQRGSQTHRPVDIRARKWHRKRGHKWAWCDQFVRGRESKPQPPGQCCALRASQLCAAAALQLPASNTRDHTRHHSAATLWAAELPPPRTPP